MNKQPKVEWDEATKTATCILEDGDKIYCGVAACHPDDYDMCSEKTGCEIAVRRATIEAYRGYKRIIKERLGALNQYYYSINMSKKFNEKSYENKMLQRQIRFLKDDLATINKLIDSEYENLRTYINEKDKFYKRIRFIRNEEGSRNVLADNKN